MSILLKKKSGNQGPIIKSKSELEPKKKHHTIQTSIEPADDVGKTFSISYQKSTSQIFLGNWY